MNSIPFIFSVTVLAPVKQKLWSPCFSVFIAFVFKIFHKSHSSVTWTGWAGRVWAASLSHSTLWCLCTLLPKGKQKGEMVMKQWKKDFLPENISWSGWEGDQDSFVLWGLTMNMKLDWLQRLNGNFNQPKAQGRTWWAAFAFRAWREGFWGCSTTVSLPSTSILGRLKEFQNSC